MKARTNHRLKVGLTVFISLVLITPFLQQQLGILKMRGLAGAVVLAEDVPFTWEGWFDRSFQHKKTIYLNEHFGFRTSMVQLHNQLDFSLFEEVHAKGVVIGKEWYLYEKNYIRAVKGLDFLGDSLIRAQTARIAQVQDTLQKLGVHLQMILAAGKGTFFPEYLPARFDSIPNGPTNYATYLQSFDEAGVHHVDFNAWFRAMKDTSRYPLYPRCGIHWSKYGEHLVADSLLRLVGQLGPWRLPRLVTDTIVMDDFNRSTDYDIGRGANLLFRLPTYPMAYPEFHVERDSLTTMPTVLTIADSHYWGLFNMGISRDFFNNGRFWFYNQGIYPDSYESPLFVKDIDVRAAVEQQDVVLLMSTDANLHKFPFGFIEQLHAAYFPHIQ